MGHESSDEWHFSLRNGSRTGLLVIRFLRNRFIQLHLPLDCAKVRMTCSRFVSFPDYIASPNNWSERPGEQTIGNSA